MGGAHGCFQSWESFGCLGIRCGSDRQAVWLRDILFSVYINNGVDWHGPGLEPCFGTSETEGAVQMNVDQGAGVRGVYVAGGKSVRDRVFTRQWDLDMRRTIIRCR